MTLFKGIWNEIAAESKMQNDHQKVNVLSPSKHHYC